MANTATVVVLTAGTATFATKWYATNTADFRIPVATLLLAAGFDAMAHFDPKGATILSFMVLIGAMTTQFNGKSAVTLLGGLGKQTTPKNTGVTLA